MGCISQCSAFKRAIKELDRLDSFGGLCGPENSSKKVNEKAPPYSQYIISATDLKDFRALSKRVKKNPFISKKSKSLFDRRLIYHAYRQGEGRLNAPDPELLKQVQVEAIKWKKKQIMYAEGPEDLSEKQMEQLEEIAKYPKILEPLLKNPAQLSLFFKWSILRPLSARVFAEFPPIVKKISQCYLKHRIGAFKDGEGLQLVEKDGKKKVTLLMEGKPVSILNGRKKVEFFGGLTYDVNQIFEIFKRKNVDDNCLTYMENGVINYDPNLMWPRVFTPGVKNQLDLDMPNWHRQLPMKAHMTLEEATAYFGFPCDGTNWVLSVVSARMSENLDTFGSHSFMRLLIPRGDGTYDYTYGWGKFARLLPQNLLHTLTFLFQPKCATLQYPDNNEIYPRQQKEKHFNLSPQKGEACLESLRYDIIQSRKNQLPFLTVDDNCTDWLAKKVKKFGEPKKNDLFDVCYLDLEPTGIFSCILKVLRIAPDCIRRVVLSIVAFFLGGCTKMVINKPDGRRKVISVFEKPPWVLTNPFRHPGVLFRKQEQIAGVK